MNHSHPVIRTRSAIGHSSEKEYSHITLQQDIIDNTIDLTQEHDVEIIHSTQSPRERRNRKPTEFYRPIDDSSSSARAIERKRRPSTIITQNMSRYRSLGQKQRQILDGKYMGARVGKYFSNQLYLGTITSCDTYYHVVYDDEDEEDLDAEELMECLALYTQIGKNKRATSTSEIYCLTPLSKEPAKKSKIKESKQARLKSITQRAHKQQPSMGPSLFEQHNITRTQIYAISQLLDTHHQIHAIPITEFFLFCYERQMIWKRRRLGVCHGEYLTKDRKMASNFFCNIYRELDRGTTYFRGNLIHHRTRWSDSPGGVGYVLEEVLWDSLCYRLVNKIETFERFGRIPHRGEWNAFVHQTLQPLWRRENTVFTGAHQTIGRDRYLYTMNSLWENDGAFVKELAMQISSSTDIKTCYSIVLRVRNVGKFLAWQVVCDLIEARVVPFSEDEWVKLGPGAVNGLQVIFGDSLCKSPCFLEKAVFLREIQQDVYQALNMSFPKFIGRDMTLKNIEHALCEFCKYKNTIVTRKFDLNGYGSRSHLDFSKGCRICNEFLGRSLIKLCDLCRSGYCVSCSDDSGRDASDAWLCSDCIQIEYQCTENM